MTALALRPRERRLALVASVLIGCWGLLSWVVQPLWEHLRTMRLQVEAQSQKLDALSRVLARAPSVEQEYHAVAAFLETGDQEQAQGEFLSALEDLSRASSVQLNLKPKPLKSGDRLSRFEIELDVEGAQQNLMGFLDALMRMPKLISVDRVRISGVPGKPEMLRANLLIQKLTLHPANTGVHTHSSSTES